MTGVRRFSERHSVESTTRDSQIRSNFGSPEPASDPTDLQIVPADEDLPSAASVASATMLPSFTPVELAVQEDVHQFQGDELHVPATPPRKKRERTIDQKLPDEKLYKTKRRRVRRKEDMGGCFAPRCTSRRSHPHP